MTPEQPAIPEKSVLPYIIIGIVIGVLLTIIIFQFLGPSIRAAFLRYFAIGPGFGFGAILTAAGVNFVVTIGDRGTKSL